MSIRKSVLFVAVIAVLLGGMVHAGEDLKAGAKAVAKKYGAAIVPVKIVISVQVTRGGQAAPARENQSEVFATVLNGDGVMVTSNLAADPSSAFPTNQPGIKIESNIKSAKLIQKDGTELALDIVLRDKDLDLMFLRPKKKTELAHVGMGKTGAKLALVDDLLVLSRLGAIGDRELKVTIARVEAVISKPRLFYVTDFIVGMTSVGCPVFDGKGKMAGVVVMRIQTGARGNRLPVILPVAAITEDMGQIEAPDEE
jgi:hypothetical protein